MTLNTRLLLALAGLSAVAGHGFLSVPASRNWLARQQGEEYCHHCLNGGTVGTVRANSIGGVWPYPESPETSVRHGLCGDPADGYQKFMEGSSVVDSNARETYQAGSVMDVSFVITTHHRGHVEFFLCDKSTLADPSGPITQECLNQHQLEVLPGDQSFVDPAYPHRFFLPPKCASGGAEGADWNSGDYHYSAQLKLPAGLECEHCVLQWYYVTGNTCNAPGYRTTPWPTSHADCDGDGPGLGWWSPQLSDCSSGSYPEEFWNCADLRLASSDTNPTNPPSSIVSPTSSPPTNVQPTPHPTSPTDQPTNPPTNEGTCTLPKWASCTSGGCCSGSLQCFRQHQWYSQCLDSCPPGWECQTTQPQPTDPPINPPTATEHPTTTPPTTQPPTTTPPTTQPPTTTPPTTQPPTGSNTCTLGEWASCGGGGCCSAGLQCFRQHQWYSQCLKACPAGWECESNPDPPTLQPTAAAVPTPESNPDPPTLQPTPFPTDTVPTDTVSTDTDTVLPTVSPPQAGPNPWDMTTTVIKYNGQRVQVQGFAVTCLEYLLRGIGSQCMAAYNWNDPSNIITSVNREQVDSLLSMLSPKANIMSSVRFSLNAAYYLDVETTNWAANRARYPNLANQYRTLLDNLVNEFTSNGILVILDLHWNDDVTEQQEMALRDLDGTTGDSVSFWDQLAQRYGDNELVWYELYNEPIGTSLSYTDWVLGRDRYEGMLPMYNAIRAHTVNPIVLAGKDNYAYDAANLITFESQYDLLNVVNNLHPYMGPYQKDDPSKNIDGYELRVEQLLTQTGKPLIITEFGQYCCQDNGACYLYPGVYEGQPMGFVEAVLTVNLRYDVSWTAWAWRPNSGSGDCLQPDANDGAALYDSSNHNNLGADWSSLYPAFYGLVTST